MMTIGGTVRHREGDFGVFGDCRCGGQGQAGADHVAAIDHLFPVYVTFQMIWPTSSATSKLPSLATASPTGRPQAKGGFLDFPSQKPVRKFSKPPTARPFFILMRTTL